MTTLFSAVVSTVGIPAIIYRFFDAEGRLLYIGLTSQGVTRWAEHSRYQKWWRQVATVTVTHFDRYEAAHRAEQEAIRAENPIHNRMRYVHVGSRPHVRIRARGMGTVFRRSRDGRWVAEVTRHRSNHTTYRVSTSRATREEAELALEELRAG